MADTYSITELCNISIHLVSRLAYALWARVKIELTNKNNDTVGLYNTVLELYELLSPLNVER